VGFDLMLVIMYWNYLDADDDADILGYFKLICI
jgi:hypothetical protein